MIDHPSPDTANSGPHGSLRIALIAGVLGKGGAEKQLLYIVRALRDARVDVRVYTLTRGEFYESRLRALGISVVFVGHSPSTLLRIFRLKRAMGSFDPHLVQSCHYYTNLYAAIVGALLHVPSIGAVRNDFLSEVKANGIWGKWLARATSLLLVNSEAARKNALSSGIAQKRLAGLSNVIDVDDFDSRANDLHIPYDPPAEIIAVAVCRLVPAKRLDRFIAALDLTCRSVPGLAGLIVGSGPERTRLEEIARTRGLLDTRLKFLGARDDVPALLSRAAFLVLTSDHEGCPNVVLEAMAARIPVITVPAGEAPIVVEDGVTGYVVPPDEPLQLAERMRQLAESPTRRIAMGGAGRLRVEEFFAMRGLAERLFAIYVQCARTARNNRLMRILAPYTASPSASNTLKAPLSDHANARP